MRIALFLITIFLLTGCSSIFPEFRRMKGDQIVLVRDPLPDHENRISKENRIEGYDGSLENKAIVVLRATHQYPPKYFKNPGQKTSVTFTTQSEQAPYTNYVEAYKEDFYNASALRYYSKNNRFLAAVIPSGTYRYIFSVINNRAQSRFSPTRKIEFTVAAGEVKYIGDLILVITEDDLYEEKHLFGLMKHWVFKEDFIDYEFIVENDFKKAKEFYSSILDRPDKPLALDLMTNEPIPDFETYLSPQCNGLVFHMKYQPVRPICKH